MRQEELRPSSRERAEAIARDILQAFEAGEIPKALATIFIYRKVEVPSRAWTWTNRLIAIRRGHVYAAGFRQWEALGRSVRKGERAFHILAPRIVKAKEDDEARGVKEGDPVNRGFLIVPVFGYLQTEGEPLPGTEGEPEFIDALPLVEVARSWGLTVSLFSREDSPGRLGVYSHGRGISLATRNFAVWAHELVHAAEDRIGTLVRSVEAEVVAELGGAVLLEALGYQDESDRGGVFKYLTEQAKVKQRNVLGLATELLERTCRAVTYLLDEAEKLEAFEIREVLPPEPVLAASLV